VGGVVASAARRQEEAGEAGVNELVEAWELPRSFALDAMADVAGERLTEPDIRARVISSRGDFLTLQVIEGAWTEHARMLLYVREHGPFEVIRREAWPLGRLLLTLRAWPTRF
jgi:hypothetical protein